VSIVYDLRWFYPSQSYIRLCDAIDEVLFAAQALRAAQYPPQFRVVTALHRLDAAVAAWEAAMVECHLDSDTNGFDRSQRWEGGEHSNEQSNRGPQVHAERWACRSSSGGGQPQDEAEPAAPSPAQRTGST
jgi:hypothetical protein